MAAEQGDVEAQRAVGMMYSFGTWVDTDKHRASKHLKMAADQGDKKAQYNIGVMYAYGKGVAVDWGRAFKYHKMATILDSFVSYNTPRCYNAYQKKDYYLIAQCSRARVEEGADAIINRSGYGIIDHLRRESQGYF